MQLLLTLDDSINQYEAEGMAQGFLTGEYPWCVDAAVVRSGHCGKCAADNKELVQQPITQAKAAETLPQGEICPYCEGREVVAMNMGDDGHTEYCSHCNGTGKLPLA